MERERPQDGRGQQGLLALQPLSSAVPEDPAPRDVLILRDPRESRRKCSLTPLQGKPGVRFVEYRASGALEAEGRVLLHTEGELLSPADAGRGLLLLDCAWRRVPDLLGTVRGEFVKRRLPAIATAYPRVSRVFVDPLEGLASIEALFAASCLLGAPDLELLAGYHFAERFLELNASVLEVGR